jgi:hypothetical protein
MSTNGRVGPSSRGVRLRSVALPAEHGGWGLLFEPIVLGLLVAPSLAGLCVAVGATSAFLARHPFKLAVADWRRGGRSYRATLAKWFGGFYLFVSAIAFAAAFKATDRGLLLPLLIAAPIVAVQLLYDSFSRSRSLVAELAGAISTGGVATAIAMAAGWPRQAAFGLWLILAARTVPTILYVRARLRLLHGKTAATGPVIVMHVLATLIGLGSALLGVIPFLAVAALAVLLLRAVLGLSIRGRLVTAKELGIRELGFGAMTVFTAFLGYLIGW